MLRISREAPADGKKELVLRLEGQVKGAWVEELRRVCDETVGEGGSSDARLVLDLADVMFVDANGVALLRLLSNRHVLLTHCSPFVAEQLREVADDES
jgi:anti-anti-sigma regulatory factor